MAEPQSEALLLGMPSGGAKQTTTPIEVPTGSEPWRTEPSGHLLSIAAPPCDIQTAAMIPNLLAYVGDVVVVDVGGGCYQATAETRRAQGQAVFRIDPAAVLGEGGDSLDLLDLVEPLSSPTQARRVVELVCGPPWGLWEELAAGFLTAIIGYIRAVPEKRSGALPEVVRTLQSDDPTYNLFVVMDTLGAILPEYADRELAAFLNLTSTERARIIATALSKLQKIPTSGVAAHALAPSPVLTSLVAGKPSTVYLIVPPAASGAELQLTRVLLDTLLTAFRMRAPHESPLPLFLVDARVSLGHSVPLAEALVSADPMSCRIWTFWSTLHKLRKTYPARWQSMVSGCSVVQVFPTHHYGIAAETAALIGIPAHAVQKLTAPQTLISTQGRCLLLHGFSQSPDSSKTAR